MDDFIPFTTIMLLLFIGVIQLHCSSNSCNEETKQYIMYTIVAAIYIYNIYFLLLGFNTYNHNLWKVIGVLVVGSIVMYSWMCEKKCYEMFIPTFYIIVPCLMTILNFYIYFFENQE